MLIYQLLLITKDNFDYPSLDTALFQLRQIFKGLKTICNGYNFL